MAAGRRKIMREAAQIGVPWEHDVAALRAIVPTVLEPLRQRLQAPALADPRALPDYYKQPFHAYDHGNLGYLPALEAEVSSRAVHAKFDREHPLRGDDSLRGNALRILADRWDAQRGATRGPPAAILDVGCSVGLSSADLAARFPAARVVGVDASAEMLAVGAHRRPHVEYVHALGEALPQQFAAKFDIVSIQLVFHELPDAPMREILREAARALRPGGMIAVMDVHAASFEDVHPIFMALFKSTEPFFDDHSARDVGAAIAAAGFENVEFGWNTPRHRTYTAFKP
jgi:SAM-dependent methyltransferase